MLNNSTLPRRKGRRTMNLPMTLAVAGLIGLLLLQVVQLTGWRETGDSAVSRTIESDQNDAGGSRAAPALGRQRAGMGQLSKGSGTAEAAPDGEPRGWVVERLTSVGDLLLSERRSVAAPRDHVQQYRVRNCRPRSLEFAVSSPSCGCLGFERDGAKLELGRPWSLAANSESVITARFPLPNAAGSVERGFDLAELANARTIASSRLVWRVEIHDDLVVDPPLLRFVHRGGVVQSRGLALSISVYAPAGDFLITPAVELPEAGWLRLGVVSPDGACEKVGNRLRFQRFHVALNVDTARLPHMVAAGRATDEASVQVALPYGRPPHARSPNSPRPNVIVPISLEDAAQLNAPALIHFGAVRLGTTAKRSVLVSSRDLGVFSLREASVEGAGRVDVALAERVAPYQIIAVSFTPSSAGDQRGKLKLAPATADYGATMIEYQATVPDSP